MNEISHAIVTISYNPARLSGRFTLTKDADTSSIWQHLKVRAYTDPASIVEPLVIEMPWPTALDVIREFGTKSVQRSLAFRFAVDSSANALVNDFAAEVRAAKSARDTLTVKVSVDEIKEALKSKGFTKRELKPFQFRDLQHLLSLSHGAN